MTELASDCVSENVPEFVSDMQRLEADSSTQRRERSGGQLVRSAELYVHRNSSPRARITTRFVTPWGAGRASGPSMSVHCCTAITAACYEYPGIGAFKTKLGHA